MYLKIALLIAVIPLNAFADETFIKWYQNGSVEIRSEITGQPPEYARIDGRKGPLVNQHDRILGEVPGPVRNGAESLRKALDSYVKQADGQVPDAEIETARFMDSGLVEIETYSVSKKERKQITIKLSDGTAMHNNKKIREAPSAARNGLEALRLALKTVFKSHGEVIHKAR